MAAKRLYQPDDPRDRAILLSLLEEEEDDMSLVEEFEDESDTDTEDHVEARQDDSDTDQLFTDENASDDDLSDEEDDFFLGKDKCTRWRKTASSQRVKRKPHNIFTHIPGVKGPAKEAKTPYQSWSYFITDDMLDIIVQWTNQYIESVRPKFQRERDAKLTDKTEIKAVIGLLFLAGVVRSNRQSLEELWGTDGTGIEMFRVVMNIKRFKFLLRCMRFDDKSTRDTRRKTDKLAPVREVFTLFNENCKNCYSVGQNVTIDEMLVAFRGRCGFRQYIPSKPAKYGIKIFSLVDSRHYYTHNLEIYAGKQPEGPYQLSTKPVDIVMRLAEPIYQSGRNITADNWFTAVSLVTELKDKKLSYVGTMKKKTSENFLCNSYQLKIEVRKVVSLDFQRIQL